MTVKAPREPWKPVAVADTPPKVRVSGMVSKQDIRAIKNCWAGVATEHEQRLAIEAIMYSIARAGDQTYRPDGAGGVRDSDFASGMRHVGLQVQKFAEAGNVYLVNDNDKTD